MAVATAPPRLRAAAGRRLHPRTGGVVYLYLAAAALVLAAASLLWASTPSYDPWAWLIWGRELSHGTLSTTDGPTWKPLPVLFTTMFAPFGDRQPDLWLLVARWGAILAAMMSFRVAARLVWQASPRVASTTVERLTSMLPAALAGAIALGGLVLSHHFVSDSALGYSEGLAMSFELIALERAVDGHHRQAFVAGTVVAWARPESWLIWGPYGLWLMVRDREVRALVIGLAVLTLLIWFVPQKLGGGAFTSGVNRAQSPNANSPAFASFPFWAEFRDGAWPSVLRSIRIAAGCGLVAAVILAVVHRRRFRVWRATPEGRLALAIAALGLGGAAWWGLIGVETQLGFSGNERYLLLGSALVNICAGASVGWGAVTLTRFAARRRRSWRGTQLAITTLASTALLATVYLFLPTGWIGDQTVSPTAVRYSLHYQASLRRDLRDLVALAGGSNAVARCGRVMTESFQVPMVAWYMDLPLSQVEEQPHLDSADHAPVTDGRWPATIFQARASPGSPRLPLTKTILGWEAQGARYTVTQVRTVTMYQDCRTR